MIRWLIRLMFGLVILGLVLATAALLLKDTILKELIQSRIRRATGMDAQIGKVDVSFLTPMVTIDNLKLYNPASFGGSLALNMPELHLEYEPNAARAGKVKLALMRLNISEVDVVQDKKGRINFDSVSQKAASATNNATHHEPGPEFAGIDTLNLSFGTLRWKNLATGRERVYQIGIKDQVFHGIKSEADLAAVVALASANSATNLNWSLSDMLGNLLGR